MDRSRWIAAAFVAVVSAAVSPAAVAQSVALAGQMGRKALLVVDGQTLTMGVGETRQGVTLLSLDAQQARVRVAGRETLLRTGASPVAVGGAAAATGGREIVLSAGPGGHFLASGAINGRATQFMVDTGATMVAIGQGEAERLSIDFRQGKRGMVQTANGPAPAWQVTLSAVRIGEVTLANVQAVVTPAPMPYILLGNSFLSRFQMRRENDVMRLELR